MQIPFYIKATFLLLLSALMVFCLIVTKDILMPVMLSLVVALVIYPLAIKLQKMGINWFFASLFSLSIILILLAGIFVLIYFQIRNIYFEIPTIEGSVSDTINQIIYYLNQNFNLGIKYSDFSLEKIINQFSGSGLSLLNSTLTSIGDLVTFLLLIPIYVFLILLNKDNYKKFLVKIVDTESQNQLAKTIEDIKTTASNYIIGLITVIIFVGILNSVGLMIIGIEHAIFWGFLASTLTIIPYIGIFIGSILPVLYALLVNESIIDAVYVLALFNFVQFLEGNFITPNIVGSKISINALTSILALIAGGMIWGISGMVLAMPTIAIMKAIFNNIESMKPIAQLMGEETATQNEDFYILLKHKLSKFFKKKNENSSQ